MARPPHSGPLPVPNLPLEMACPSGLETVCGGKLIYLIETFNWPRGDAASEVFFDVGPFVICFEAASEPSCVELADGSVDLDGAGGIYSLDADG